MIINHRHQSTIVPGNRHRVVSIECAQSILPTHKTPTTRILITYADNSCEIITCFSNSKEPLSVKKITAKQLFKNTVGKEELETNLLER